MQKIAQLDPVLTVSAVRSLRTWRNWRHLGMRIIRLHCRSVLPSIVCRR